MTVAPNEGSKISHHLTNPFFDGGHFTEEDQPTTTMNMYRLSIAYCDGDKVNLELIAGSFSGVMEVQRLLQTKPFASSCIYKINNKS